MIFCDNLTIGHRIGKKFDTKIFFGQKSNKTIGENIILVASYYIVWKCWTRKEKPKDLISCRTLLLWCRTLIRTRRYDSFANFGLILIVLSYFGHQILKIRSRNENCSSTWLHVKYAETSFKLKSVPENIHRTLL